MNRDPSVAAAMLQGQKNVDNPVDESPDDAGMSRKKKMRRKSGKAGGQATERSGLEGDPDPGDLKQDTPGRPKSASSRQQTQPQQKVLTGNDEQDDDK
jgi:hypothetical protein